MAIRPTISNKIIIGIATIVCLNLLATIVVFFGITRVDSALQHVTTVEEPLSAAAYEMEINTIGTGLGVLKYFSTGDPVYQERVRKDKDDFLRFHNQYMELAETPEEKMLGDQVYERYTEFYQQGIQLMSSISQQSALLTEIAELKDLLRSQIDHELESINPAEASVFFRQLDRININLEKIGTEFGEYRHQPHKKYKQRLLTDIDQLQKSIQHFRENVVKENDIAFTSALQNNFLQLSLLIKKNVAQHESILSSISNFLRLRDTLDNILDDKIQISAKTKLSAAAYDATLASNRVLITVIIATILFLLFSMISGAFIIEAIRRPLHKLMRGTDIIAKGNLAHRLPVEGNNELSELTQHFNTMAEQLEYTVVSKERLEKEITERRLAEDNLEEQALRDNLTTLYNRRYFNIRVPKAIKNADHNNTSLAILLCHIDHLKRLNAEHGQQQGDKVLCELAAKLQGLNTSHDLVFRWGGNEIAMVQPSTTRYNALKQAIKARSIVTSYAETHQLPIDASIGIAISPDHGNTADALTHMAEKALFIAREDDHKIHVGEENYHLDTTTVDTVFQPIVDLSSAQHPIIAHEGLSRDPTGKLDITTFFQKYQAIGRINELKLICFQNQIRNAASNGLTKVFLNADLKAFEALAPFVKPNTLEIVLEISEAEALHDVEEQLSMARAWREKGFKIAIDDFGAGFISLPYIAKLQPDYIKLDRSVLVQATENETFRKFLKNLVKALQNYTKEGIVAEGIETQAELDTALNIGATLGQGFLLGMPNHLAIKANTPQANSLTATTLSS